ncbi:hypothetical protein CGZ60_10515 [Neisseria animalis]|nr:hypothetical protein CGZ60_10515 [Neisseria animalis]
MIIFFLYVMLFKLILIYVEKIYDEEYIFKNNTDISIKKLTNFKWSYAKIFIENIDFQKISFFYNNKLIYEQSLKVDNEGLPVSQVIYTSNKRKKEDLNHIVYYKCPYEISSLKFIKTLSTEHSHDKYRHFVFYEPIGCKAVRYNEYLKEF